jgi:hypothetical protein
VGLLILWWLIGHHEIEKVPLEVAVHGNLQDLLIFHLDKEHDADRT